VSDQQRYSAETLAILQSINENTKAVTQLAQATAQLISYMADEDEGEQPEPLQYMDGSRIK